MNCSTDLMANKLTVTGIYVGPGVDVCVVFCVVVDVVVRDVVDGVGVLLVVVERWVVEVVVVERGVVVVVVVTFFTHLQSQSAMPVAVAKENVELSPSSKAKNPLSSANFRGFADFALNCESFITPMKVLLSTSIDTTLDPTVASS